MVLNVLNALHTSYTRAQPKTNSQCQKNRENFNLFIWIIWKYDINIYMYCRIIIHHYPITNWRKTVTRSNRQHAYHYIVKFNRLSCWWAEIKMNSYQRFNLFLLRFQQVISTRTCKQLSFSHIVHTSVLRLFLFISHFFISSHRKYFLFIALDSVLLL